MSKQDRQGVRTPADLERKYDFAGILRQEQNAQSQSEQISRLEQAFSQFTVTVNSEIKKLQEQISENDIPEVYPVGAIYLSVTETDPSTLFGGTWERIAKGQVLVGVDEEIPDFAAAETSGGISHDSFEQFGNATFELDENGNLIYEVEAVAEEELNPLKSYTTCYMWKRTA